MADAPAAATLDEIVRLVAFDTTSRDSNLELIDYVAQRLRAVGIEPVLVPDESAPKANLYATFPASDGSVAGGVVLSAHTDTVPVDGQVWASDPFAVLQRDGRLYGRGTADMKSFLAVMLAKLPRFVEAPLATPIHWALSYDEEVGCTGAVSLVDALVAAGLRPDACVVGEPTSMQAIRGHKSINAVQVDVHGLAAHSSLPTKGVNAITYATRFVAFINEVAAAFAEQGPFDDGYVVPYTTVNVNQIDGGIALNTIPSDCRFVFEFRSIGADDPNALLERFRAEARRLEAEMRQHHPDARIDLTVIASAPGLDTAADAPVLARVAGWGAEPSPGKVTYGTEAGLFHAAGIPTVVCGPGDIAQAHAPDEFIELDQIARCETFLDALIADARRS